MSTRRFTLLALIFFGAFALYYGLRGPQNSHQTDKPENIFEELEAIHEDIAPFVWHEPKKPAPKAPLRAPASRQEISNDSEIDNFIKQLSDKSNPHQAFENPSKFLIASRFDGRWVTQGDILIDEKSMVAGEPDSEARLARIEKINLWPKNLVPYKIDSILNTKPILEALSFMSKQTHVRFVEYAGETDFIYFRATDKKVCLSFLGRVGGEQEILINQEVCSTGNILHEIMHAIGFVHEHSREDRDDFVTIHWNEIPPGAQNQFQKMTSDLSKPSLGAFDFDSILLYSSRAFSISDRPTLTKKDGAEFEANRSQLSKGDVEKINTLYPPLKENL